MATTHFILYVVLTIFGAGYVTTDKIEGFSDRTQCERQASLLYSIRGVTVSHVCLEVK
jgi:hypothetical protein